MFAYHYLIDKPDKYFCTSKKELLNTITISRFALFFFRFVAKHCYWLAITIMQQLKWLVMNKMHLQKREIKFVDAQGICYLKNIGTYL